MPFDSMPEATKAKRKNQPASNMMTNIPNAIPVMANILPRNRSFLILIKAKIPKIIAIMQGTDLVSRLNNMSNSELYLIFTDPIGNSENSPIIKLAIAKCRTYFTHQSYLSWTFFSEKSSLFNLNIKLISKIGAAFR